MVSPPLNINFPMSSQYSQKRLPQPHTISQHKLNVCSFLLVYLLQIKKTYPTGINMTYIVRQRKYLLLYKRGEHQLVVQMLFHTLHLCPPFFPQYDFSP